LICWICCNGFLAAADFIEDYFRHDALRGSVTMSAPESGGRLAGIKTSATSPGRFSVPRKTGEYKMASPSLR
jgi:hypothetical protein